MIASPSFSCQPVTPPPSHRAQPPKPAGNGTSRELPHDDDLEALFISSVLLDGPTVLPMAIMAGVDRPEKLYDPKLATVYGILLELYNANKPLTISLLAAELTRRKELDTLGGYAWLSQVTSRVPTTAEAASIVDSVRAYGLRRAVIRSRTDSVEAAYKAEGDIDQFLAELTSKEAAVTANGSNLSEETTAEVCDALLAQLDLPKSQRTGTKGERSWGVSDIDNICGKMAPGTLNILAACPSGGKSALSQQAAWACARSGSDAVYFSFEMLKTDLVVRIAQQESGLNLDKFDEAPVDLKVRFTKAVREIRASNRIHLFERDNTVQRIAARCRTLHQKAPLGLIVVDFLQYLARLEPSVGKERSDEKLGRITGALKQIAKECECPVLLLSSLNREGYKQGAGKPTMATLRASGEIESDADVILFLHWPDKNPHTGQEQDPHDSSQGTFYVEARQDKGRSKGVREVGVTFERSATKFTNWQR